MIPWNQTFMEMAETAAKRSTCSRIQVGCVLVKDRRVISMGYNGTPSGFIHCKDYFNDNMKPAELGHHQFAIQFELHAEQNVIGFAARYGIPTDGTTLYTTISPCIQCAKLIIASGIKEVIYKTKYDRDEDNGLELLSLLHIKTTQFPL